MVQMFSLTVQLTPVKSDAISSFYCPLPLKYWEWQLYIEIQSLCTQNQPFYSMVEKRGNVGKVPCPMPQLPVCSCEVLNPGKSCVRTNGLPTKPHT